MVKIGSNFGHKLWKLVENCQNGWKGQKLRTIGYK
jgi:hypothetical protein